MVENLNRRSVSSLVYFGYLVLFGEQFIEGFLNLEIPQQPGILNPQFGDFRGRDENVAGDFFACGRLFQFPNLSLELGDPILEFLNLRILLGLIGTKHAQLDFLAGKLALELRNCRDYRRRLVVDAYGLMLFLEILQTVSAWARSFLTSLARFQKGPFPSCASHAEPEIDLFQVHHVGIGHIGGSFWVLVIHADRNYSAILVERDIRVFARSSYALTRYSSS